VIEVVDLILIAAFLSPRRQSGQAGINQAHLA
jgi:hypothetical protein